MLGIDGNMPVSSSSLHLCELGKERKFRSNPGRQDWIAASVALQQGRAWSEPWRFCNIPVAGLPSVWCLYSKQHSAGFKSRMERAEDSLGTNTSFLLTCNNDRWLCLIQRFAYEAIQGNRSGNLMPKSALKIELTFRKILQVTLRALFSPEEKAAGGSNI